MTANPLVEAHDVVLGYDGHVAIDTSTFTIPRVGLTAIIGPNGSGKSTVLSAIAGLIEPFKGDLTVFGGSPSNARSRISYVLQSTPVPQVTPITVREVVALGRYPRLGLFRPFRATDRQAVAEALDTMAITDLAGRHMHELSGGQRQRVLIAQGLAQPHDLLLLDEPLTGLDFISAATIDDVIHTQSASGGVILTTHDLDEARAADWVVLVSGRVVAAGPPEEVCVRSNLEAAYGLGSLHEWQGFLDDPHDSHHHDSR
jgi:ABC-type Mn2+/Zn2+ transport system ATPase subunit